MKYKSITILGALLFSASSFAEIQTRQVTADYLYVSGREFQSQEASTVSLMVEDISAGTGKCGITGGRMNTVVGVNIAADTVWMGLGSSAVGDGYWNVYQATLGGCLTDLNRTLQSRTYKMSNFPEGYPIEEIVTLKFAADSLKVLSVTVEYKQVATGKVYESFKANLE